MNPTDEVITRCLEEIDANFVKAIDIVTSMNKTIKSISTNMKELDACSQNWIAFFNLCGGPTKELSGARESIGTLVLTEDENATDIRTPSSGINEENSDSFLKYMSPPRTTRIYKPLNTPGRDRETSAMDTSTSSYYGYSPPQTPLLKRRKADDPSPVY